MHDGQQCWLNVLDDEPHNDIRGSNLDHNVRIIYDSYASYRLYEMHSIAI